MTRRSTRAALLALAVTLAGGMAAGGTPETVHTALEAAYPAEDSVHAEAVTEIRLRYTTPVQLELSAISLLGPEGQVETAPVDTIPGTNAAEIGVSLEEPLPSGAYTVEWRTAGPDSHVIRGSYSFTVDRPEPELVDTAAMEPQEADTAAPELAAQSGGTEAAGWGPGGIALNWLFLLSVVGMLGVVAFRAATLGPLAAVDGLEPVRSALQRRLTALAWLTAVLAVGVLPFRLAYQAATVAGPGASWTGSVGTVLGLPWGSAWLLEVAAAALFLAALLLLRKAESPRMPWLLAGAAALLMALVPALSGHSRAAGTLGIAADALHVVGAGVWAGGLGCLVLAGIPAAGRGRTEEGEAPGLPVVVSAFSPMALVAVGVLVASGLVGAFQHISLDELLTTPYGRLYSVKVTGALAAFALGFYNWRVVRPQLRETPRTRLIRIPATMELLVALGVLAVTAAVIVTARP